MHIYIDADGCPVVRETVRQAREHGLACTIVCDTSHEFSFDGVETLVVDKGADSVDFALVARIAAGDLAITQDYGLAAMCLSRGARALRQDGVEYTEAQIDAMLFFRAAAKKIRNGGGRLKGPGRRTSAQDAAFSAALRQILAESDK